MSAIRPPPTLQDADDLLHDAMAAHRAGDLAAAEQGYRDLLAVAPGQFLALRLLGVLCGQAGRLEEATALLRRAVALQPRDAEARRNLAVACERAGNLAEAAAQYARAADLDPADAAAPFGLGCCHEGAGRQAEAIACYRQAIALAPGHARAHNNLANLLAGTDPVAAANLLARAIQLDPDYPEALNNLGALLLEHDDAASAAPLLQRAVALRPGYVEATANLGAALRALGQEAEGMALLREALAAAPASVPLHLLLARALAERGEGAAAEATLRAARALDPENPQTRLHLAQLLHHLGRFAEAEALFAPLADAGALRGLASFGLVHTRRQDAADRPRMAAMAALAEEASLPVEQRVALRFALGKAFADLGDPAAAMRHYDAGNALKRGTLDPFDRDAHTAMIDRLIATYTPELFRTRSTWASESNRPLLVVGMMRSGTTLLEQMLAAHPAVAGGGELTYWALAGKGGEALPQDAAAAAALVAGYLAELERVAPGARHVTDKLPHNVYALGLIHLLFPRARILHCRRAAADVGLSIYRTLFAAPHDFAYDQDDIAFVLRGYARLAAHWRAVLPAEAMLEVPYEALVTAPDATVRQVLAFCGLHWDARCLDPGASRRLIRTASAWQVRQKVHAGAVGTARRYAPWLGALAALPDTGD